MINWHTIFGIASGLVLLLGNIPYVLSIRRGDTKPNRVTWGIWTTIGLILLGSSYSSGATNTLWLLVSIVVSQSIITFYAFKYGRGKWQKLDRLCLVGAGLSLLLWLLSGSPLVAILMNTTMDMLGAVPTISKIYRDPDSEDLLFWSMSFTSAVLNLFAIEHFSLSFVVFPIYLFILNVIILVLITRPKWSKTSTNISKAKKTKKKKKNATSDFI
jgi:general stress protein CsbA